MQSRSLSVCGTHGCQAQPQAHSSPVDPTDRLPAFGLPVHPSFGLISNSCHSQEQTEWLVILSRDASLQQSVLTQPLLSETLPSSNLLLLFFLSLSKEGEAQPSISCPLHSRSSCPVCLVMAERMGQLDQVHGGMKPSRRGSRGGQD